MTSEQPQPGDVWEHKSGEWREYLETTAACGIRVVKYRDRCGVSYSLIPPWNRWQSGATLIQRKGPTQ